MTYTSTTSTPINPPMPLDYHLCTITMTVAVPIYGDVVNGAEVRKQEPALAAIQEHDCSVDVIVTALQQADGVLVLGYSSRPLALS